MIFVAYSGEEEGLYGSTHLAQRLHAAGYKIVSAFTDDIVGNVVADDGTVDSTSVRIFGAEPDNGPSRELARYAWATGTIYNPGFQILPVFRLDRISRGGDHSPYVSLGDPGLRFTERLENYKRQHLPTDDFAHVNFGYVANIARLNASVVGTLANAPAPPAALARRDQASGGAKWMLSWRPSPGAASYEVLFRRTTAPTYEKIYQAGAGTSFLLPDQLDDGWAAVRAVGANGHRSLTSAVPPPCPILTTRADSVAAGDLIRNCIRAPALQPGDRATQRCFGGRRGIPWRRASSDSRWRSRGRTSRTRPNNRSSREMHLPRRTLPPSWPCRRRIRSGIERVVPCHSARVVVALEIDRSLSVAAAIFPANVYWPGASAEYSPVKLTPP